MVLLGTSRTIKLPRVDRIGDVSYGTYLYGFPVEQVVRSLIGPSSGWLLFIAALPVAWLCGYISWWTVEEPGLRLKKYRLMLVRPVFPAARGMASSTPEREASEPEAQDAA